MEIPKALSPDVASVRTGVAAPSGRDSQAADVALPADFADIRPLDISAALAILLAEVRAALDSALQTALVPGSASQGLVQGPAQGPLQAARALAEMFLKALPEEAGDAAASTAAWVRIDGAVQSGFGRAASIITQWRDVPQPVVEAAKETQALFIAALGDDAENPVWLQPEWLGLYPLFQRSRRRRRNVRRRLADPDYATGSLDDEGRESPF